MNVQQEHDADLKNVVKQTYGQIAVKNRENASASCCTGASCSTTDVFKEDGYEQLEGYTPVADYGLGCGLPTKFAGLTPGQTVVDLGSGAGNDAFVARAEVGEQGKVIGIDFTPEMIEAAQANAAKLGFDNVEFRQGDIEETPLDDNLADVVVSNCVLNLVPDKRKAFTEMWRILQPGGHFSVSDIVTLSDLPQEILKAAELYTGCISGAQHIDAYMENIRQRGFTDIHIMKQTEIRLPKELLSETMTSEQFADFEAREPHLASVTVFGRKPRQSSCCDPQCCSEE